MYSKYLLRIGNDTFPMKYISEKTYTAYASVQDLDSYRVTICRVFEHDVTVHRRESPACFRQPRFLSLRIRLPLLQSGFVGGDQPVGLIDSGTAQVARKLVERLLVMAENEPSQCLSMMPMK